jgi:hypothetical protein
MGHTWLSQGSMTDPSDLRPDSSSDLDQAPIDLSSSAMLWGVLPASSVARRSAPESIRRRMQTAKEEMRSKKR